MEKCSIGIHTRYWGHSFVEAYEALRRGGPFEDTAGRTHWLMAANQQRTSATIRVFHTQDHET